MISARSVRIEDSRIGHQQKAIELAPGNATAWLSDSMLFGNALGLDTLGTGVINDFGDNRFVANTVDGTRRMT